MRQIFNKEAYEAPSTSMRVVLMEGNCMAASNEQVVYDKNSQADINYQEGFDNTTKGIVDFSGDESWKISR